jgi:hypothetical protein
MRRPELSWVKDPRVIALGVACALTGFLVALLIFGSPWHLPPAWGDIPTWFTAIGTILVATVAIWVAFWTDVRTGQRVDAERAQAAKDLAEERAHSAAQLASQQDFSRIQADKERQTALDREQLAEAALVEVLNGRIHPVSDNLYNEPDLTISELAAVVVNHGKYVITKVEVRFYFGPSRIAEDVSPTRAEWSTRGDGHGQGMAGTLNEPYENRGSRTATLGPWDERLRFQSEPLNTEASATAYAVIRWTDRWRNRWEHQLGDVRKIEEDLPWK